MKKLLAIIISLVLVLSFTGCKDKTKESDTFKIVNENGTELKIEYLQVEDFGDNKIYLTIKDDKFVGVTVEFDSASYKFKEVKYMVGSFNCEYDYTKAESGVFNLTNPINLVITDGDTKTASLKTIKFTPVYYKLENGEVTTETVSYELSVKLHDLVDFLELDHNHE